MHGEVTRGRGKGGRRSRGSVTLLVALALPALLAVLGLGIDIAYWAMTRQEVQRIADLAALAGVARYGAGGQASEALNVAASVAELNGLPAGLRGGDGATTLTDTAGAYAATITFIAPATLAVTIVKTVPRLFSALFLTSGTQPVAARAVARLLPRAHGGHACLLALSGAGETVLDDGASLRMAGCDLRANGTMTLGAVSAVDVANLVAGGTIGPEGNDVCPALTCIQYAAQAADPYAALYGPLLAVPSRTVGLPRGQTMLTPPPAGAAYAWPPDAGSYTLAPGIYDIDGDFSVHAGTTLTGTGVTFIVNGNVTIDGNAALHLAAPATGPAAGLLFAATGGLFQLAGGAATVLTGTLYAPRASLVLDGDNAAAGDCLYAVAASITLPGGAGFADADCQAPGMTPIPDLPGVASLVE
ncbi:TadE family protein [Gluconacetobacter sacchari DSM 12717]|uniref:TadE family protein n=1 Tax=Gluconacetobacter sacchari DSM 12717 TaxID=1307940 RepID=A0ABQ0PAF6_9PROT|nr:pilus assembly protein TadG-related protein [Gluconacetobacter sacchari]GBQ29000.1 TadE family protein [Gluconacetobacter sacchari DSM 12717]